ncbi:MAG TPA: FecR domain-containing protein [Chitinophagaceae bacterium]|nr:FecR domain-containing protein [Chitinophagaceae bacterium]
MMNRLDSRIAFLFRRYLDGAITAPEFSELIEFIRIDPEAPVILQLLEEAQQTADITPAPDTNWDKMLNEILVQRSPAKVKRLWNWKRIAVAASIAGLLLMAGYWIFQNKKSTLGDDPPVAVQSDIKAPDKNRAAITLEGGQIVYLDSVNSGAIAMQHNTNLVKTDDGQLRYDLTANGPSTSQAYNTLSNPRGSKIISLTLSDGTRVWLNNESELTYPVSFAGNERKVEIKGEAYFEVAKDPRRKFIVSSNGVGTEVLGTHFNVNAYKDEGNIKVTLLEGSVRVSRPPEASGGSGQSAILKPGEQARIPDRASRISVSRGVNLEDVMSWKNGRFYFDSVNIKTIMRQLSRWYNVDIEYKDEISYSFVAKINRDVPVSELLNLLQLTDLVHFKIENNKIIVMK